MNRTLLFALALAVIPVGIDAQDTPSDSCSDINLASPLEDVRPCADQGDAGAQSALGVMYATGEGVPQDGAEALRWFTLAAEQGYARGQSGLGLMYARGQGVPQDNAEAERWFRLAAEQGFAGAQFNLGVMYAQGLGVPEDIVLAYMWFNLAEDRGNESALDNKDFAEQQMTREQIAEAQRLSREWIEAHPPAGN